MGWSLYNTYRECPQLFNLRYCLDGDGVRPRESGISEAMLYGSLWHAVWRAHIGKRDLREAAQEVILEDGLLPGEWEELVNEVLADFQWFVDEPKTFKLRVLMAESELAVPVPCVRHYPNLAEADPAACPDCGRHEMRGTIDLLGVIEAEWGSDVVLIDWKTADKVNDPRNWARHRSSRQLTYYMAVLQRAHPDIGRARGLIGMVPSHILDKLSRKRKKDDPPPGVRLVWALRDQAHLDRAVRDYREAADEIMRKLDSKEPFAENSHACVNFGICPMLPLCDATPEAWEGLHDNLYAPRLAPREPHEVAAEHTLDGFDAEVNV
jgi:hypothetical protein